MGIDLDCLSDDSGSVLSIDEELNFSSPVPRKRQTNQRHQPEAKTKTVYLQLSGDKYRCAIRSDATWEQLKAAVEARLGLPPDVARLASIRGARDGALIRTGHDIEAGEYLDIKLDLRELAKSSKKSGKGSPPSSPANRNRFMMATTDESQDNREHIPSLDKKSWVQSTNIRSISQRCPGGKDTKFFSKTDVSPWVQAATGTTILAPMITSKNMSQTQQQGKKTLLRIRPTSAPMSRSKSQLHASKYGKDDIRYHGGTWSKVNLPDKTQIGTVIDFDQREHPIDNPSSNFHNKSGIVAEKANNSQKSRVRPSSAPVVRSVVTSVQPVMPMAVGATEAMTAVFSNPMDPRQRQQYMQMGEFESQREQRMGMAHKLNNPQVTSLNHTSGERNSNSNTKSQASVKSSSSKKHHHHHHHHHHHSHSQHQRSSSKPGPLPPAPQGTKFNYNSSDRRSTTQRKPWLPTRNCNHKSAIISEVFPLMSHDGVGGPSHARAERY